MLSARNFLRHPLIVSVVGVLVAFGLAYVFVLAPKTYASSSSMLLLSPKPPPTPEQIAADPSLANVNANNPYAQLDDLSVIVQVVDAKLATTQGAARLRASGASGSYSIIASSRSANGSLAQIDAKASSPSEAKKTATVVANAFAAELRDLQKAQGVDDGYLVRAEVVVAPENGRLTLSTALRNGILIVVVGVVALLLLTSGADVLRQSRANRRRLRRSPDAVGGSVEAVPDLRVAWRIQNGAEVSPQMQVEAEELPHREPRGL